MKDYKKMINDLRERAWREEEYYEHGGDIINDAANAIEELQALLGEAENSVERWKDMFLTKHEPKHGEWIHGRELGNEWIYDHWVTYFEDWRCSNCGVVFEQESKPKYNYCPHCGAKMGVQDDS